LGKGGEEILGYFSERHSSMTIMHVTDWASGGLATYLETVCNAQSHKYKTYLLASTENSEERIVKREEFIPLESYSRTPKGIISALLTTRKKIQKLQPDIVFIHSTFAGVFARLAAIGIDHKPKIIYCAHGWSFLMKGNPLKQKIYQWIELGLSSLTDTIITISENEHQEAIKIGISKNKLIKIDHGISEERENLDPHYIDSDTFKCENNKLNILFLGRYDHQKGFDWLINFIERNATDNICWHSAGKSIVGEQLFIPHNILDHGWVPYECIPQLLLRCDAIIMPSRWEGFGLTAIEAMKYAKPIIASKNGALPELIQNNQNGWLFDMKNDLELKRILDQLDRTKLDDAGKIGYHFFNSKYCESKMINTLDNLYIHVLDQKDK